MMSIRVSFENDIVRIVNFSLTLLGFGHDALLSQAKKTIRAYLPWSSEAQWLMINSGGNLLAPLKLQVCLLLMFRLSYVQNII
ncbi:unnamed protein product [Blepharisma stoltei]|uniref:Uncharacterized protein n=1 Tax=Blepharisma stoltei TaxID=1481888 RepID=A0AAU9JKA0_9CILI|nr:unnamed protein product [Blepharisma stoltei]